MPFKCLFFILYNTTHIFGPVLINFWAQRTYLPCTTWPGDRASRRRCCTSAPASCPRWRWRGSWARSAAPAAPWAPSTCTVARADWYLNRPSWLCTRNGRCRGRSWRSRSAGRRRPSPVGNWAWNKTGRVQFDNAVNLAEVITLKSRQTIIKQFRGMQRRTWGPIIKARTGVAS